VTTTTMPISKIARTGDWTLFEANLYPSTLGTGSRTYIIGYEGTGAVIIDDIKIQPFNSKMTAYVYDLKDYKLSATLDENHFATFYQYDEEGKLVRKLRETILGIKTAEEAHNHMPSQAR